MNTKLQQRINGQAQAQTHGLSDMPQSCAEAAHESGFVSDERR
jgi:hypothetical protein